MVCFGGIPVLGTWNLIGRRFQLWNWVGIRIRVRLQQFNVVFKLKQFRVIGKCSDMFHYNTYLIPPLINGFIILAFMLLFP